MPNDVIVIGCGVIGLSTAITLQKQNFNVKIVTAKLPAETTSAVAAAIWLPYQAQPIDKVMKWSSDSYIHYEFLSEDLSSGVKMIDMTIVIGSEEDAWWKDALPSHKIRKAVETELPNLHRLGYILNVPMIETHLHLQYLLDLFKSEGGIVEMSEVLSFDEFRNDITVINCTGLAAKILTDDDKLFPIQGQIVYLSPDPKIRCTVSEIAEGKNNDEFAYIIPRSDHTVLGGTAKMNNSGLIPDLDQANAIMKRCHKLDSSINPQKYISTTVGLRPGRSEIRLERENNIIHNYGHGGAGYTVAWGCANSVLALIDQK